MYTTSKHIWPLKKRNKINTKSCSWKTDDCWMSLLLCCCHFMLWHYWYVFQGTVRSSVIQFDPLWKGGRFCACVFHKLIINLTSIRSKDLQQVHIIYYMFLWFHIWQNLLWDCTKRMGAGPHVWLLLSDDHGNLHFLLTFPLAPPWGWCCVFNWNNYKVLDGLLWNFVKTFMVP